MELSTYDDAIRNLVLLYFYSFMPMVEKYKMATQGYMCEIELM